MAAGRRRRIRLAVALSAAAHVGVLTWAVLQTPTLRDRPDPDAWDEQPIPVLILPRRAVETPARAQPSPIRARQPREVPAALPLAPLPAAPAQGPPTPAAEPEGPAVATLLRKSRVGCANAATANLSRAEREACEERLAEGAKAAPHLWGMEPAKREYYAAVAEAKAPSPAPVQARPIGRMGLFDTDMRGTKGHLPGIGCKIHFGRGHKPPNAPPHALKLGPCFIEPPAGSLSPDVDIAPP